MLPTSGIAALHNSPTDWKRARDMQAELYEKARCYATEALAEDNAGNRATALDLYKLTLESFSKLLEIESNPRVRDAVITKFKEYLERAEALKRLLAKAAKPFEGRPAALPVSTERIWSAAESAVREDSAGNYANALVLYIRTLEYLSIQLKSDMHPSTRIAVVAAFKGYLARAEELKQII